MRNNCFGKLRLPIRSSVLWFFALLGVLANKLPTRSHSAADEVGTQTIDRRGKTIVPRSDAKFQDEGDNLTITVMRDGTEEAAKADDFQARRVVQSVKGDFAIEVTFGAYLPLPERPDEAEKIYKAYVSGGLLLWIDGRKHVRLERASFICGTSKHYYVNFEMWSGGRSVRMGRFADLPSSPVLGMNWESPN